MNKLFFIKRKYLRLLLLFTFSFFLIPFSLNAQTQTELWGMTYMGGADGNGIIFKTAGTGADLQVVYPFLSDVSGNNPQNTQLCQGTNGKLYGMTAGGGANNFGVLFEYDPATNSYTKKIDFAGITNGRSPSSSLMQASNGKLYGVTFGGGANDKGILFEYDPTTDILSKKLDFTGTTNGSNPQGKLIQATNGKLYGMAYGGGVNDKGVLFEYDPSASVYTKKLDFAGTTNGSNPYGSVMQASNGKLYGMTYSGGANSCGVIFDYDPSTGVFTKKLDFAGTTNGAYPYGDFIQASNGKLYGMTTGGGTNNLGTLFEYNPSTGAYTKKLDFAGTTNGSNPYGSLMQASNGKLYGMTYIGGANSFGVLFEYNPTTSTYTKKLDFAGTSNGSGPYGSLMQASNGTFYGTTFQGGANNLGVLFEYDPAASIYTKKLDFGKATNGSYPYGSLMQASNGKLYSMTSGGGANGLGVLFECDPATSTYTKIREFSGTTNGSYPYGSLIQASNGKLYGMTYGGGANGLGVLFEYDPATGTYVKKLDFAGTTNGSNPWGSLIQAVNGKLYGMTSGGGTNGLGVLFEYNPATGTYVKKLDFAGTTSGSSPRSTLMQASSGKLYGMTRLGGVNGLGVLFEYNPATGTYVKKLDFAGTTNGSNPRGALIQAVNGKIYGMTYGGGASDRGVLFEYDSATGTYVKKLEFAGTINGSYPYGSLMQTVNGKIYGMTYGGGASDKGVLFEYDPASSIYTKKLDFNGTNGQTPYFTNLIEICVQPIVSQNPDETTICSGTGTVFNTVASGNGLSYSWQVDAGSGFGDIIDNTTYSNTATSSLTITNATVALNGYKYRCRVTSTCPVVSIYSSEAILTVNALPEKPAISQEGNILHSTATAGNQWYNQSGIIAGATGQDYTITESGDYYVITTLNGCSSVPSDILNVTLTGIRDYETGRRLLVYPNPVPDELIIESEGNIEKTIIEIFNSNGLKVYSGFIYDKVVVNTSGFAPGIYLVKIGNGKSIEIRKILKGNRISTELQEIPEK